MTADIPLEKLIQKYRTPHSHFINVNGLTVHYQRIGDVHKPALLLLHGVASSSHTWQGWSEQLAPDFCVFSIDIPSFGLSDPFMERTPPTAAKYMHFLDQLVGALQLPHFHLAGNSLGGWLTWHYALHNPQRVNKIILVNATGLSYAVQHNPMNWRHNLGFALVTHPLTRHLSKLITSRYLIARELRGMFANPHLVSQSLITRHHELLRRTGVRTAASETLSMPDLWRPNAQQRLSQIKQPTLILWGAHDKMLLPAEGELLHQTIAHSQLIIYPNAGHLPMEEIPEQSAHDARMFLLG
ncbi:MAG: alpha/beta fold hydrolase [Formosimonas sp.]